MPLGVVQSERRGRDIVWFVHDLGNHQRRPLNQASLKGQGFGALRLEDLDDDLDVEFDIADRGMINVRRYVVAPGRIRHLVDSQGCGNVGLAIDKFLLRSAGQNFQRGALVQVLNVNREPSSEFRREYPLLFTGRNGAPGNTRAGGTEG